MKILITLLMLLTNSTFAMDNTIRIKSDPWCPFACSTENQNRLGLIVDIAKYVFEKRNYKIKYENVNFARAISDTRSGINEAIAGCAKEDAADFVFPKNPQASTKYSYFASKNSKFNYVDPTSLVNFKVGAINGYAYDSETTAEIQKKNSNIIVISGDDGLTQLMKMLNSKRIESFVESEAVFKNFLSENKLDMNLYKKVGTPKQDAQNIFICFSPKNPKSLEWAKWIDEGLNEMKKNGEYKKLLTKYKM